jgi:hypothetical protein
MVAAAGIVHAAFEHVPNLVLPLAMLPSLKRVEQERV